MATIDHKTMDDTADGPLPNCIRRRLLALLKLQKQLVETDVEFHRRLFDLEREFNEKRQTNYAKRAGIINGDYEPNDEDSNLDFLVSDVVKSSLQISNEENDAPAIKGIPNFWSETLNNSTMVDIHECDRTVLKHLTDIQLALSNDPQLKFTITFRFDANPFFENDTLTKEYLVEHAMEAGEPFAYDGAQIHKSIGCDIKWKEGMDLTKNQNSFFKFFSPPSTDIETELDPNVFDDVTNDFESGLFIKETLIPKAVIYFLCNEFDANGSSSSSMSSSSCDIANEEVLEDAGFN